jgi:GNAT superfamily N-acetyltransferase
MDLRIDPHPSEDELNTLWRAAWEETQPRDFSAVLARSLGHVGAYEGSDFIGFVNIAWDGGMHAFILDTCVHPAFRHRGTGTALVKTAAEVAKTRGAHWLHVDFAPQLTEFYQGCGFTPTSAGLMRLS